VWSPKGTTLRVIRCPTLQVSQFLFPGQRSDTFLTDHVNTKQWTKVSLYPLLVLIKNQHSTLACQWETSEGAAMINEGSSLHTPGKKRTWKHERNAILDHSDLCMVKRIDTEFMFMRKLFQLNTHSMSGAVFGMNTAKNWISMGKVPNKENYFDRVTMYCLLSGGEVPCLY